MILFTKKNCQKCDLIKDLIKKHGITGIEVKEVDLHIRTDEDVARMVEVIADLAWFEIVDLSQELMPILVDEGKVYAGYIAIKKHLINNN